MGEVQERLGDFLAAEGRVFNRIQEKCIKGNSFERTWITTNSGQTIYRSKVREVQAINENLRINQGLWTLLELFRVMKEGK